MEFHFLTFQKRFESLIQMVNSYLNRCFMCTFAHRIELFWKNSSNSVCKSVCMCKQMCTCALFCTGCANYRQSAHRDIYIHYSYTKRVCRTNTIQQGKTIRNSPQAIGILYNSWKAPPPPSRENNNKTATTRQPTTCKNETGSNANNISLNVSAQAPKGCEEVSSRALALMQQPCLEHWIIAWGWQKNCHKKDRGCLFYFIHVYVNKLCIRIISNVW